MAKIDLDKLQQKPLEVDADELAVEHKAALKRALGQHKQFGDQQFTERKSPQVAVWAYFLSGLPALAVFSVIFVVGGGFENLTNSDNQFQAENFTPRANVEVAESNQANPDANTGNQPLEEFQDRNLESKLSEFYSLPEPTTGSDIRLDFEETITYNLSGEVEVGLNRETWFITERTETEFGVYTSTYPAVVTIRNSLGEPLEKTVVDNFRNSEFYLCEGCAPVDFSLIPQANSEVYGFEQRGLYTEAERGQIVDCRTDLARERFPCQTTYLNTNSRDYIYRVEAQQILADPAIWDDFGAWQERVESQPYLDYLGEVPLYGYQFHQVQEDFEDIETGLRRRVIHYIPVNRAQSNPDSIDLSGRDEYYFREGEPFLFRSRFEAQVRTAEQPDRTSEGLILQD